jgi:hypothetical protein
MEAPQSNVASLPGIGRPDATGRVNPDGQEMVIDEKVVVAALPGLERLYREKQEASEAFNDAVKKAAEKAGVNSGPLKKLVVARCKEKTEELARDQEQLALMLFAASERD